MNHTFASQACPVRLVYFATGSMAEVAEDFQRLRPASNGSRLRVVAPQSACAEMLSLLRITPEELLPYRPALAPLLWVRLMFFLGFSDGVAVVCLSSPQRHRFLKLLALALRGRVIFSPMAGERVPLSPADLARIWLRQALHAREDRRKPLAIGVIGSASAYYLGRIVPALRARYPEAALHGLLLPRSVSTGAHLFDEVRQVGPGPFGYLGEFLRLLAARNRYQRWIVPCTNEPYRSLKLRAFLWPLARRQVYNELGDGFPVRRLRTLWRHLHWRLRDRLSYQVVAGAAHNGPLLRWVHVAAFALRILSAAPVLAMAVLRGSGPRQGADTLGRPLRLTGASLLARKSDEQARSIRALGSGGSPAASGHAGGGPVAGD